MVPTTKVTTIPGGGESGNSLPSFPMVAMPSVSPEMSAVPTPEMEGEPKMTMEAESKGKDYEGEMTNVAVESNANDDGLVMKSPEVEMTKAYEMMMESYMTVTAAAAETDRPKQYAEEETEEMMPSPNTYSSVEDGDTTTTTTITSANNSSTNNIDEDDMATVSLTDASSPTSSNTDLILPSSSPSPEYLDDLLDDVDDATETHSEPTSNTSSAGDDTPLITPEPDEEVCIDARLLAHLPASDLVYGDKHRRAAVLCDDTGSCATPGHMVRFHGQAMSMRTYCKTNGAVARCVRRVALVNSPRYGLGVKVASKTSGLEFSVHAARFATGMEEWILRTVMRMGL